MAIVNSVAEHHVSLINNEVETSYNRWFSDLPEEIKNAMQIISAVTKGQRLV